jgi:hypothetical protein
VAMETFSTDHNGSYVGATAGELKKIEPTIKESKEGSEGIIVKEAAALSYTIESISSNTHVFTVTNTEGTMAFACTPKEKGGCPSTGNWGE